MTTDEIDKTRDLIAIYQLAEHHNVVRLEDYFENEANFYLCLELHSTKTLSKFIKEIDTDMEESRARDLILKIG